MANCGNIELNFPNDPTAGQIWRDPANDIEYIYDGYKWDVYQDKDNLQNHWVRNEAQQRLTPRDPDDRIRTSGYQFAWLKNLREAPNSKA
jgi:hypothetical protein